MSPTPLPPTAMLATMPPWASPTMATPMGGMGMVGTPTSSYYDQQALVRRAMPVMPPMMPMGNPAMMAMQYQTPIPQVMGPQMPMMPMTQPMPMLRGGGFADPGMQQALGLTAGMTTPGRAGEAMAQQWGQRVGGWGSTIGGLVGGFTPLGPLAGGMLGDLGGGALMNNPLTRGMYKFFNADMIRQVSAGAQLQQGLAGNLQLTGGDAAFGGVGMSMTGATQLGQRFQTMGTDWARTERMMGRSADTDDARRYSRDLRRITVEAGGMGLLDAATNIDQIAETSSKLMKVLGRMAKITGDPDFRNNLREIGQLRQMGFSIDQAVSATQGLGMYARAAGVSRGDIMGQGGALGVSAFQQMGLGGGVGMMYGAAAQAHARQMMGVVSPTEEMLMGGQQGMMQRTVQSQAAFAGGPMMSAMLMSAASLGPGNQVNLDPGRLRQMLGRGTNFTNMVGASQTNFMNIAQTIANRTGRSTQDVMSELIRRFPQMQTEIAQTLGPEGMMNLQLTAVGNLSKQFGVDTAAQLVGGENAGVLLAQLHPTALARRKETLDDQLSMLRGRAADESRQRGEDLRSMRSQMRVDDAFAAMRGYRSGAELREAINLRNVVGTRDADERARDIAREQDEARGIRGGVYLTATQQAMLPAAGGRVMRELAGQERERRRGAGLADLGARGMNEFGRTRAFLEEQVATGGGGVTENMFTALQTAGGERETGWGRLTAWSERNTPWASMGLNVPVGGVFAPGEEGARRIRQQMLGGAGGSRLQELSRAGIRALDIAEALSDTRNRSVLDVMKKNDQLLVGLKKRGVPTAAGEGAIAAVRSRVLAKAHELGRDGKANLDDLMDVAADELGKLPGMSPAEARSMLARNKKEWHRYLTNTVMTQGSDEAKSGMESTGATGQEVTQQIKGNLEQSINAREREFELQLVKSGFLGEESLRLYTRVMGEGLGEGEREALSTMFGGKDTEDGRALMLLQASKDTGPMGEAAAKELKKMRDATGGSERITRAEKKLKEWEKAGKTEAISVVKRGAAAVFGATGQFDVSKTTLAAAQKAVAEKLVEAQDYGMEFKGGKLVPTGRKAVAGAAPETQEEIEKKAGEISGIEDLQQQFEGFGDASIAFSSAIDKFDRVLSKFSE